MVIPDSETIAAIATPLGQGGVGIVRISGPASRAIASMVFCSARPAFADFRPYVLHHGSIVDERGRDVDDVLVSFMPGPGSYTGEDVVEINCHGGPAVLQEVLELVLRRGARLARGGEFTLRAFLNGRLDLSQAESVAEIISAPTKVALDLAENKLRGGLADKITGLRSQLEHLRRHLVVAVDFPEEDLECLSPRDLAVQVREVEGDIAELLENYKRFACWREGVRVVLAGKVNAGKSSLLNTLLGRTRAIVTPVPGTTRDYIEESINLDGLPVRLFDTAGIRQTQDLIEQTGLALGQGLIQAADLVCLLYDSTAAIDKEIKNLVLELGPDRVLILANKVDLPGFDEQSWNWFVGHGFQSLRVSAKLGAGVDELLMGIRKRIIGQRPEPQEDTLVPNLRQQELLQLALEDLRNLRLDAEQGVPYDLLGVHLELACNRLSEITGEIRSDKVLNDIFSSFCIGK